MGLDVDWVYADKALDRIRDKLDGTPHGERKEITDKIIAFADSLGASK